MSSKLNGLRLNHDLIGAETSSIFGVDSNNFMILSLSGRILKFTSDRFEKS